MGSFMVVGFMVVFVVELMVVVYSSACGSAYGSFMVVFMGVFYGSGCGAFVVEVMVVFVVAFSVYGFYGSVCSSVL